MRRTVFLSACLALVAACGGDPIEESMDIMEDMASVLEDIKDESSAKAAKPKLEKLAERMKAVQEEMNEDEMPPEERMEKLKEYGERMEKVQKRLMKEMFRIASDPKLSAALDEAMKDMDRAMR